MRVLWITNIPMDDVDRHFGRPTQGSGFWMRALLPHLQARGAQVGVATAGKDPDYHLSIGGVDHFNLHESRASRRVPFPGALRAQLRRFSRIVEQFRPDLIHVHGTERPLGLVAAQGYTRVPAVVSIQGIARECHRVWLGALSLRETVSTLRAIDVLRGDALPSSRARFRRQVPREEELIRAAKAVIGRTEWDRSHVRAIDPECRYFHIDEMIRQEFWSALPWAPHPSGENVVFTTSGVFPLKGMTTVLEAIAILRSWGCPVRLRAAGVSETQRPVGMVSHILKKIRALGLERSVELLGWMDGQALVSEILQSACFVNASFVENSSNAICEAQLVGAPCVAAAAGGTPSLIHDGATGLLFPPNDPIMLAAKIERVLRDTSLSRALGGAARAAARERHDPETIVSRTAACYAECTGAERARPGRPELAVEPLTGRRGARI